MLDLIVLNKRLEDTILKKLAEKDKIVKEKDAQLAENDKIVKQKDAQLTVSRFMNALYLLKKGNALTNRIESSVLKTVDKSVLEDLTTCVKDCFEKVKNDDESYLNNLLLELETNLKINENK